MRRLNAVSIEGFAKSLRRRVWRYPAFSVQGQRYIGSDFSRVDDLISQVKREHVPAVFGSEVFPSSVLQQVAKEAGARYVDKLRDDELPPPPNHTYVGMMGEDVTTIVSSLGGDAAALREVPGR